MLGHKKMLRERFILLDVIKIKGGELIRWLNYLKLNPG
jgi:hypothetical protein